MHIRNMKSNVSSEGPFPKRNVKPSLETLYSPCILYIVSTLTFYISRSFIYSTHPQALFTSAAD